MLKLILRLFRRWNRERSQMIPLAPRDVQVSVPWWIIFPVNRYSQSLGGQFPSQKDRSNARTTERDSHRSNNPGDVARIAETEDGWHTHDNQDKNHCNGSHGYDKFWTTKRKLPLFFQSLEPIPPTHPSSKGFSTLQLPRRRGSSTGRVSYRTDYPSREPIEFVPWNGSGKSTENSTSTRGDGVTLHA